VQYTIARAMDDASAFSSAGLAGAWIAQNWLDLDAEHAPSDFDQRHQLVVQVEYTTGAGRRATMEGWAGTLFKGWTMAGQLTVGSGLPLTPLHLAPIADTGFVGVRPDLTGQPVDEAPPGYVFNPVAFAAPAPGQWGTAGRNSVRGPGQFTCDASAARTFFVGDRVNLDWRVEATNVLNRVTYAGVNTIVGSAQFGLPNVANPMRKVVASVRVRF
jgi:hypothetical protein